MSKARGGVSKEEERRSNALADGGSHPNHEVRFRGQGPGFKSLGIAGLRELSSRLRIRRILVWSSRRVELHNSRLGYRGRLSMTDGMPHPLLKSPLSIFFQKITCGLLKEIGSDKMTNKRYWDPRPACKAESWSDVERQ
jgi:hypothetical protein